MGITLSFRLLVGAFVAVLCAEASAENVTAFGPIEKISSNGRVVQVLGQTFTIGGSLIADGKIQLSDEQENLRLGTYLYIEGERSLGGALVALSLQISETPYVPGATEVLLTGVVSKFDQALGVVTIGTTQIYVPNAFVEPATQIVEGASISVMGYQADPRQQIWATQIGNSESVRVQEEGPTSLSIQGTGVNSQSIQGTGKQSIQGTGRQSIQGTGKQSIQGTGKQSIQGTGVSSLSIQGTGVNSLSIQGTGKLSIQGTGKQSIQGTGINSLSIQGTG